MKSIKIICLLNLLIAGLISCSGNEHRYIDLNTGKDIDVVKDSTNGYWINAETKEPLMVYYDSKTKDTLFGTTGEVINNKVTKTVQGKYYYEIPKPAEVIVKTQDEIDQELLKNGGYKKKVEKDGDIKIKHGDKKIKIDAETGKKKVKQ